MTYTFCTSGQVAFKAGAGVSTAITEANYNDAVNRAENYINDACKIEGINLVTGYSALQTDVKKILEDAASSKAAIEAINFDMSGYTSRQEAQIMLDVNYTILDDCIQLLKQKPVTDYIRSF